MRNDQCSHLQFPHKQLPGCWLRPVAAQGVTAALVTAAWGEVASGPKNALTGPIGHARDRTSLLHMCFALTSGYFLQQNGSNRALWIRKRLYYHFVEVHIGNVTDTSPAIKRSAPHVFRAIHKLTRVLLKSKLCLELVIQKKKKSCSSVDKAWYKPFNWFLPGTI